jgi:N,N'-diacetyllegionaminate synthase
MTITIDGRAIGPGRKPYIIAEAADAHMGSMDYAKALVRMAASCGADAIKFQHHLPDEEMLPDSGPLADNLPEEGLYQWLKTHAFTLDQHREIKKFCVQEGITYLCTPFSWKAAQDINDLVPAFKIGSGEAQDFPTLERIAKLGKPMIVSTGMCSKAEVFQLAAFMERKYAGNYVLMHCVSEYPPSASDLNIGAMGDILEVLGIVGYSSHWPRIEDAVVAMALGACIIEKHISLSGHLHGPDADVSLDEDELAELCKLSYTIPAMMGREKSVLDAEKPVRAWAYRSLVIIRPMKAGDTITQDDIWSKRPGTGIPAKLMPSYIGRKVTVDIPANTMLKEDMLCA